MGRTTGRQISRSRHWAALGERSFETYTLLERTIEIPPLAGDACPACQRVSGTMVFVPKPSPLPLALPDSYPDVLAKLKAEVRSAQLRAHRAVNTELIRLYWQIGRAIVERQDAEGWGAKVIDRLAKDLREEFPQMTGLSRRSIQYMRQLAADHPESAFAQQVAAQMPWGHLMLLLDKIPAPADREWYAAQVIENGWSRAVLAAQISTDAKARLGAAPSNFSDRLPTPESDLAQEMVKDPYVFEFLTMSATATERQLEDQLVTNLQATLLELGRGFAFVGRQYHFEVAGDDFFIDLLFFNFEQNRFVVVELKVGRFKPEHTGQLNMYVQWVDRHLRRPEHAETVGLLLCADRNDEVVTLALGGTTSPMAVADWKALPAARHAALPEVDAVVQAVEETGGSIQLTLHRYFGDRGRWPQP